MLNKKLNNNDLNNDTNNKIMSKQTKEKIEKSSNVSNKEALKDKIHEIHNYLRNHGAGYGMNALKVFNLLYGLKKIEENNLLDKVNLKRPECEFSYLLKLANKNKDQELAKVILTDVLTSIYRSNISDLLFYELPSKIKSSVFTHLIKEINKITIIEKTCNVLLSGKIYEYFIGRDQTAISELGAYFTDRHIVDYIYDKLNPEINDDGSVDTMIDMFGGSGGFTTGYINYLNNKYEDIDWEENINNIYHYDMNEDVIKSAGLEFFCLTGVLPNMDNNLRYKNSFKDDFNDKKYKYVITNPPYGGDKLTQSDALNKRKKIKDYIKKELLTLKDEDKIKLRNEQLKELEKIDKLEKKESENNKVSVNTSSQRIIRFSTKYDLSGNDKESVSLILIMDMVEDNGTGIGVLKEGVFFNKTYKDIRKCLVENYNVREIISIPQDQFENTSTKTSIVIFDNTKEKTTQVKFSELIVEKYTEDVFEEINDEIVLIENKDDICNITDNLISVASKEEILSNNICSLNGKDYIKEQTITCGKDYKLVKLGDICNIDYGTRITKKDNIEGDIPVYGGGDITFYTNKHNRDENTLIVSRYAMSKTCVRLIPHQFYLNDSGLSLTSKNKDYQQYINHYFLINKIQELIYNNCTSGSIQRNINMNLFKEFKIPIPKSDEKLNEWDSKISKSYNKMLSKQTKLKELENDINDKIKNIIENEDYDNIKLNEISDINIGSTPDTKNHNYWNNGNIPWVSVSELNNNIIYHTNKYITKEGEKNMKNRKIPINSILLSFKLSIGKLGIAGVEMYCNEAIVYLNSKIKNIPQMYLYYILKGLDLEKYGRGTIGSNGSLNKEILSNLQIPVPKNKKLIDKMEPLFNKVEELNNDINKLKQQYEKLIEDLSKESMN